MTTPRKPETVHEAHERGYITGSRAAKRYMLSHLIRELYGDGVTKEEYTTLAVAVLVAEREEAIRNLREICADHGDNDWANDLHLADIIDKHLGRYLEQYLEEEDEDDE